MTHNQDLGEWGENVAEHKLKELGWTIVDRNVQCGNLGELDIIAKDKDELVFVEVKTRSNSFRGSALEQMTNAKQKKLMRAVQLYLRRTGQDEVLFRIDVVTLDKLANGNWKFNLLKAAVGLF